VAGIIHVCCFNYIIILVFSHPIKGPVSASLVTFLPARH
jgi:hypothetical protein